MAPGYLWRVPASVYTQSLCDERGQLMTTTGHPHGVLLVGSVPLGSAEEVFRTASTVLGERLRRIPDGETGERTNWIYWQLGMFASHPAFEMVISKSDDAYQAIPRVRRRPGASGQAITFDRLGYADAAKASYAVFKRLKQEGAIPAGVRFQVSLPTPLAPVNAFIALEDQAAVEEPYEAALLA